MSTQSAARHRVNTEQLEFGGGLEILLAASLEQVKPGGVLEVHTRWRSVALEMPGWASLNSHEVVHEASVGDGAHVVHVRRSAHPQVAETGEHVRPALRDGEFHTADWRAGNPVPQPASATGFTPLSGRTEAAVSLREWRLSERDAMWTDDVGDLVEQASRQQWDASRDIPWEAALGIDPTKEKAVAQLMTFLAQNEYAALYVPGGFLPEVNPQLVEVALWLSSHVFDEARHIEVFTKRALITGIESYALSSTELSVQTLLDERDFTSASLLLNVLGEGTFLDLLRFIELKAPDRATAAAAKLAHRDEQRHVHFGISNIRRAVSFDPDLTASLVAAAEARAAKLVSLSGLSPVLVEALTVMATPSLQPAELSEAAGAVRTLLERMERNRVRRLRACGFDHGTARYLSDLHTPNLM